MGHHVALQERWGAEDFSAGRAGVILPRVGFVDVLAVLLQGGKAHPALLAVVGIFDVCYPETQEKPQGTKKSRKKKKRIKRGIQRGRKEKGKKCLLLPRQTLALEFWLCTQMLLLLLTYSFP